MIKQFKEAVALEPDGIAIYGFPGDEAMRPIIKEAREKGIVITTMNTPLPDLEAEYKTAGFGYAGADLFTAGYNLGKKAVEVCGAGFDLSAPIVDGINSGYIDVVIDQQPFIQGYIPIVQLFLSTKYGMAGLAMDTGAAFVTADNVEAIAPLAAVQIR